jgi:hypothetical protein
MSSIAEKVILLGAMIIYARFCSAEPARSVTIYQDTIAGVHRKFTVPFERLSSSNNAIDLAGGFPSLDLNRFATQAAKHLQDKKGVQKKLRLYRAQIMPMPEAKIIFRLKKQSDAIDPNKEVCCLIFLFG